MMKKLLLIDKMSIMHASFYAMKNLCSKDGTPTGALFGFVMKLKELNESIKPDQIIVCSDLSRADLKRRKKYAGYKANRSETPMELKSQFELANQYLKMCHIPVIQIKGVEADDIAGTLAMKAADYGYEAYVASGDRDLFQLLVNPNITQIYIKDGKHYKAKEVEEKYEGLKPEQIVDMKALEGDVSDNIPGVAGIGSKTAIKLLLEYKTLQGVYDNLAKIKGKKKEYLEKGKESAFLSQDLATIDVDVPLDLEQLFAKKEFSLCTRSAYDFLVKLNIKSVYKLEDITSNIESDLIGTNESGLMANVMEKINAPIEIATPQTDEILFGDLPFSLIDTGDEYIVANSIRYNGIIDKNALALIFQQILKDENKAILDELMEIADKERVEEDAADEEVIEEIEEAKEKQSDMEVVHEESPKPLPEEKDEIDFIKASDDGQLSFL